MKNNTGLLIIGWILILMTGCESKKTSSEFKGHTDKPFIQDFSIKYFVRDENVKLFKVESDRTGVLKTVNVKTLK